MRIGIPRERKILEARVALTPKAVFALIKAGHDVYIENEAGQLSGYTNQNYQEAGAHIAAGLEDIYQADLIVKVKEPTPEELILLKPSQKLFCYLHLAAYPKVLKQLLNNKVTALAFETLTVNGALPLLAPMSAIAGRLAVQLAMQYLQKNQGGAGVLLGGDFNVYQRGCVLVLGAGIAGSQAALLAAALGTKVYVLDKSQAALDKLLKQDKRICVDIFSEDKLQQILPKADAVIGAVLVKGANAPKLLTLDLQQKLAKGRVMVDIAIDQGGCIEGIQATDWQQPIYWKNGLGYIAVTNMPAAVPRTATQLLSNAILPYVLALANGELLTNQALQSAIAVNNGQIVHTALKNLNQ